MEYDSYYYLNAVCVKDILRNEPPLSQIIFSLLPCNLPLIKILLFFCCFFSSITLALTGEIYSKKHGWKAGFLGFLSPYFFFEFMKFENDQLAYPFLFAATYFFLKSFQEKKLLNQSIAAGLLLFSALIWPGTLVYIIILAFLPGIFLLAAIPVLVVGWKTLADYVIGWAGEVAENAHLIAIGLYGSLTVGILGWIKQGKLQLELFIPGTIALLLGIWNAKWGFFAVPFLAVGFVSFLDRLSEKWAWIEKLFEIVIVGIILISFVFILIKPPTTEEHQVAQYAVSLADGNTIQNDWDLGYLIKWYGGKTNSYGGNFNDSPFGQPGITVTYQTLNCTLLKSMGGRNVYRC
jgi:hypothetical protein